MDSVHLFLLSAGLALFIALLWRFRPTLRRAALPYSKRSSLLTPAELRFYRCLLAAVPPVLVVMVKVRLMDVVTVPDGAWQSHGTKGSGMHCDFVLADINSLEPVLAIELDDRSHWSASAWERDGFKNAALDAAGVPILRVTAGRYDVGDVRTRLLRKMGEPNSTYSSPPCGGFPVE